MNAQSTSNLLFALICGFSASIAMIVLLVFIIKWTVNNMNKPPLNNITEEDEEEELMFMDYMDNDD